MIDINKASNMDGSEFDHRWTLRVAIIVFWSLWAGMLWYIYHYTGSTTYTLLQNMGILGWVQFLLSILTYFCIYKVIICPYLIYLSLLFLFSFGQSLLYPINAVTESRDLLNTLILHFGYNDIFEAQCISLLFICGIHIGAILSSALPQFKTPEITEDESKKWSDSIRLVGYGIVIISCPSFIVNTIFNISAVNENGYNGIYESNAIGTAKILAWIGQFFIIGILCLLVAEHRNKTRRMILFIIISIYILYGFFLGGRTPSMILFFILILYYHTAIHKLKFNIRTLAVIVLGLVMATICVNVANSRLESNRTLHSTITSVAPLAIDEPIYDVVSEAGWSMFPLLASRYIIPIQQPYMNGRSYLFSFLTLIPNLNFWDIHPAKKYTVLGDWLQNELGMNYGPGFSTVAEAYVNFGLFGFFFCIIYGMFQNTIFLLMPRDKIANCLLRVLMVIIYLFLTLAIIRNSFVNTIRAVCFTMLPIYILIIIVHNSIIHKNTVKAK